MAEAAGTVALISAARSETPRPDIDRRQVTVVFADVSGFTALAERLDPEDVRVFQNALFEMFAQVVTGFGGYVAKFLGDAVLAVFGAPTAHEDDPERALDAALAMLERCSPLSERWAGRLGRPVTLHVAVHTGPVVAGNLGGGAGATYDVTGDTVNTAARLVGEAPPGAILVSEATHALARHRFAFNPGGDLALRGKAEPLIVHRLIGPLGEARSARGLAAFGLSSPMIGRTDELERVVAGFERMLRGRAQFVNLVGEAGTGKSRLIAEFLRRLEDDGLLSRTAVRRTTCSSLGEPPYGTFGAFFREGYRVGTDDSLSIAREKLAKGLHSLGAPPEIADAIVPALSHLLGVVGLHRHDFEPEQLKRQISLAARALVEQRLEQMPVLMIVEDFHWADAASVDLLRDIVDHFAERPLMLLLSHRPETQPPLVARASQSIIRLASLSPEEIQALVSGLFGRIDATALERVGELVALRAGGNPLFVEEIIRRLVSEGVLVRQGDEWTIAADHNSVDVPPTLRGLLLSRVDRLAGGARRLLQEASVLGMAFDETLLNAVASEPGAVADTLDRLVEADLIRETGRGREGRCYRFTHALVQEVVYENLLLSRRSELHVRAAHALERLVGPEPSRLSDLEALGHHWSLGADKAKGAGYLIAAGDQARAIFANEDAIRFYDRALRTLADDQSDSSQMQALRERLADVLALTGQRAEALAQYEAARQDLQAGEDRTGVARLHRKIGNLHWEAGNRELARTCYAAGLQHLGEEGSPVERAQLFQEIGRLMFQVGDNACAVDWAERALAEAAREGKTHSDPEHARETAAVRVQAYNTFGVALARTGRLHEAVEKIEQSIKIAEDHDLLQATCRGYANLGVLYSSLEPDRGIETCIRGLEVAKKVGDLGFQSRLHANLAVAYCALTDRCEAEGLEAAKKAIDLDRRMGLLEHLAVPLIVLGQIHQCHGDHALAWASYEEALELAEQAGEPQLLFPCYDGLATLNLDAGNIELAEDYLAKAQEVCERSGIDADALLILPFLS